MAQDWTQGSHSRLSKLIAEKRKRRMESIRLFRPMQTQVGFIKSRAHERVLRGGNRCMSGDTLIYDPVLGIERRVDEIEWAFHVLSRNPATGEVEVKRASQPFVKGHGDLYRVTLSTGESITTTLEHRVLDESGHWVSVQDAWRDGLPLIYESVLGRVQSLVDEHGQPRSSSGTYQPVCDEGAPHSLGTTLGSLGRCFQDCHPGDEPLLPATVGGKVSVPSPSGVRGCSQTSYSMDDSVGTPTHSRPYQSSDHPSNLDAQHQILVHDDAQVFQAVATTSAQSEVRDLSVGQFVRSSAPVSHTDCAIPRDLDETFSASHPPCFAVPTGQQTTTVASVEYLRKDLIWDIEVDDYANYICSGLTNANSGKSTTSAALFASIALGIPLVGPDGQQLPHPYPTDRPLVMWVIGYDERHIGQTIARLLLRAGAFKIIKDKETGEWRAFEPWRPEDKGREKETKPAPPFLPPRYISKIAWHKRGQNVFNAITLHNGNIIYAFSSKAEAKQGDKVDVIWVDEDVRWPDHIAEWRARIVDNDGWLYWSAFPHTRNHALLDMSDRAAKQAHLEEPAVEEFRLRLSENPYLPKEAVERAIEGWSEDERRARDQGDFLSESVMVYPEFSYHLHGRPHDIGGKEDEIDKILQSRNGQPPDDWTRYLIVDPGTTLAAALLVAIPPPEMGDFVIAYDEVYQARSSATQLAGTLARRTQTVQFEAFLIDGRASRQTPLGFGRTVESEYLNAFEKAKIQSRLTGAGFFRTSDNVSAGLEMVHRWLSIRIDGTTKFRYWRPTCPNLEKELERYRKRLSKDTVQDMPDSGQADHLADCLRYIAAYDPQYYKPESFAAQGSVAFKEYQNWIQERQKDNPNSSSSFNMGPPVAV